MNEYLMQLIKIKNNESIKTIKNRQSLVTRFTVLIFTMGGFLYENSDLNFTLYVLIPLSIAALIWSVLCFFKNNIAEYFIVLDNILIYSLMNLCLLKLMGIILVFYDVISLEVKFIVMCLTFLSSVLLAIYWFVFHYFDNKSKKSSKQKSLKMPNNNLIFIISLAVMSFLYLLRYFNLYIIYGLLGGLCIFIFITFANMGLIKCLLWFYYVKIKKTTSATE